MPTQKSDCADFASRLIVMCIVVCSGALDLMDEIGAAVAMPHSPQLWEEVHRVHHSHRERSRSRSRSAIHEVMTCAKVVENL